MSDLEDNPLIVVVKAPHATLVLEPGSPCFGGRVDPPPVRVVEFPNAARFGEGRDGFFQQSPRCESPDRGPLSLDRDLRGGIGEGLGGQVAGVREELEYQVSEAGREEAASYSGVPKCLYAS